MNINDMQTSFSNLFPTVLESIQESANQLFGREVSLDFQFNDETNTIINISSEEFPRIYFSFVTNGAVSNKHLLSVEPKLGLKLFAWMIGDDPDDAVGHDHIDGLQEAANQILGQLQIQLDAEDKGFTLDNMEVRLEESVDTAVAGIEEEDGLTVSYSVTMNEQNYSILHYIWNLGGSPAAATAGEASGDEDFDVDALVNEVSGEESVEVSPADFQQMSDGGNGFTGDAGNLDMLMDVTLETVVELGRKSMPIKDVLKLGKGSVIELDKAAGEPLEIFVNGRKLAEGEVVVVDELFGIRITHLIDPKDRTKRNR